MVKLTPVKLVNMGICPTCYDHEHGHCFHIQMIPCYTHGSRGSRSFVKERHDYVEVKENSHRLREILANNL